MKHQTSEWKCTNQCSCNISVWLKVTVITFMICLSDTVCFNVVHLYDALILKTLNTSKACYRYWVQLKTYLCMTIRLTISLRLSFHVIYPANNMIQVMCKSDRIQIISWPESHDQNLLTPKAKEGLVHVNQVTSIKFFICLGVNFVISASDSTDICHALYIVLPRAPCTCACSRRFD